MWFSVKTLVFLFIYVWLRAALPRLRYDQLMDLGWKALIPLSLGWLLIVAVGARSGTGGACWSALGEVGLGLGARSRAFAVGAAAGRPSTIWARPTAPEGAR